MEEIFVHKYVYIHTYIYECMWACFNIYMYVYEFCIPKVFFAPFCLKKYIYYILYI